LGTLNRIHAVGTRLTNDAGDHRMVCRAGACRRATAHRGNGTPTSPSTPLGALSLSKRRRPYIRLHLFG
jgi:hypothetical protein